MCQLNNPGDWFAVLENNLLFITMGKVAIQTIPWSVRKILLIFWTIYTAKPVYNDHL